MPRDKSDTLYKRKNVIIEILINITKNNLCDLFLVSRDVKKVIVKDRSIALESQININIPNKSKKKYLNGGRTKLLDNKTTKVHPNKMADELGFKMNKLVNLVKLKPIVLNKSTLSSIGSVKIEPIIVRNERSKSKF